MAHFITEECIGDGACMKKCPTQAIVAVTKTQYSIRESLCFDCGVCGDLCPKSAVLDAQGRPVPKRKLSQRPKPIVDVDLCTGCEACVDICREGCVTIEAASGNDEVAVIDLTRCIGCGLCEAICIKEAVTMATNGHPAAI